MRATAAAGAAALALALAAVPARGQLWRWTDADGVVRYTNDPSTIPPAHRAGARDVGSPQPRPPAPAGTAPPASDPAVLSYAPGAPITTAARLNGTPLTLLVDTGADRTVLSPAAVARAGYDAAAGRPVRIVGVTGGAEAREVVLERLDVAGARVGPLTVIVHDAGIAGVDGLLGRDVLDRFTLTVEPAAGRAVLSPR